MGGVGVGPIPAGWLNCPNAGTVIDDTFLAFKTPLQSAFDTQLRKNRRWNPDCVFRYIKENEIPMGLWIDLTNTDRYFNKSEVEKHGIKYLKLKIGGGGEVPSPSTVKKFITHCQSFLDTHPGSVIGVHCTHGFNRTGYLICSFLTQVKRKSIDDVFTEFCVARPPGIYRQSYVSALWKIFSTPNLPVVPTVREPFWSQRSARAVGHNSKPTTPNISNPTSTSSSLIVLKRQYVHDLSHPSLPAKRAFIDQSKHPQFFGNVPGIHYVDNPLLREQVLTDVRRMCLASTSSHSTAPVPPSYFNEYPGRQGNDIRKEHLQLINENYVVTWTATTSTKYLLLIKAPQQVFFIDTTCSVFQVHGMTFPDRRDFRKAHVTDTLLEGEAVMSSYQGGVLPRFFVHDIICFHGSPLCDVNHKDRISVIKKEILEPRMSCLKNGIILRRKESPLWLNTKPFWPSCAASDILQVRDDFCVETPVGLQFMHINEPYHPRSGSSALNWRRNNYVNFRISVDFVKRNADLFLLELITPFATIPLDGHIEKFDGRIGVFKYHAEKNQWWFMEEANTFVPGSYGDALKVMSMEGLEPLSEQILLEAINHNQSIISSIPNS